MVLIFNSLLVVCSDQIPFPKETALSWPFLQWINKFCFVYSKKKKLREFSLWAVLWDPRNDPWCFKVSMILCMKYSTCKYFKDWQCVSGQMCPMPRKERQGRKIILEKSWHMRYYPLSYSLQKQIRRTGILWDKFLFKLMNI